jgi:acyl carrier protein phosphodiesterase
MMPYMISQNWLESYETLDGIETIMIQMDYRTQNKSNMRFGIKNLKSHYLLFEEEFFIFFEAIQTHINQFKNQIK